jgi:hypothetical protein
MGTKTRSGSRRKQSFAFLTPGSGMGKKSRSGSGFGIWCLFEHWIRDPGWVKKSGSGSGSGIRDEHPGLYFRELRNNFWV